jgi:hypothetical protein
MSENKNKIPPKNTNGIEKFKSDRKIRPMSPIKKGILTGVALVGIGAASAAFYVDSLFDKRIESVKGMLFKVEDSATGFESDSCCIPPLDEIGIIEKAKYIGRVRSSERYFEENLPRFLEWSDDPKNRVEIEKLSDYGPNDGEKGGYIAIIDNGFEYVFIEDPLRDLVMLYINEIRNGDYSHKMKYLDYLKAHHGPDSELYSATVAALNLLEKFDLAREFGERVVLYNSSTGKIIEFSDEKIKEIELLKSEILNNEEAMLKLCYSRTGKEMQCEPDFFAYFHHHPKGNGIKSNPPSENDINNTNVFGPGIVFPVYDDGRLEVYSVLRGESKLERTYKWK